jgi:release factor glutamine methyltransferase
MAYILGYKDFYKMRFIVGPGVLIPRPETELIVENAVRLGPFLQMADLGCGSGCIGLSLLGEFPGSRLWACDNSKKALAFTSANAKQLNFMDRIEYSLGDVTANKTENKYDLIVSNPPYIDHADTRVAADVRDHEPAVALFAHDNGLEFYNSWLPWAYRALKNGGWAMFEFGDGQAGDVMTLANASGFKNVEIKKDLSGKERVLLAQKKD